MPSLKKYFWSILLLVLLIGITAGIIVKENDMSAVLDAVRGLNPWILAVGAALALFFVVAEGLDFYILFRPLHRKVTLRSCIGWGFVGFFFSAITPSASGGQPAQIYYMHKKGIPVSESTPVLLMVAILYNATTALFGVLLFIFQSALVRAHFGSYVWLLYLGIGLHLGLVAVLAFVMIRPNVFLPLALGAERLAVRLHILKPQEDRPQKIRDWVNQYRQAVACFRTNQFPVFLTVIVNFFRRFGTFFLTYLIYRGMGLNDADCLTVVSLQAAICLTVEALPLPGAMGISELIYSIAFAGVFTGEQLAASLCISRGLSFYFVLLVSIVVLIIQTLAFRHGSRNLAAARSK